jgi:para-nitrobenzyl esterase
MKNIEIMTQTGNLIGIDGTKSNQFLGIPYAIPPIGEKRFKRAKPVPKTTKTINCTQFGNKAYQPKVGTLNFENDINQSEDCLYLNVWTPKVKGSAKPVVVWIHGGAFIMGETGHKIYNGENFVVNGGIIFVSIQYRLGIFGFMDFSYLNDDLDVFETNIGLTDQIEALRWIQENIGYFGGDKNNVTVMGESAGATSVLSLITSPKATNLFHKAICESAVVGSILTKENARFWAEKAMGLMGLDRDNAADLMKLSPEVAIEVTSQINKTFTDIMPGAWPFAPVIDGDLLPNNIIEAYQKNQVLNIPLLLGTNKDEASNFVRDNEPWLPSNEKHINRMFELNPHLDKENILSNYITYPNIPALRNLGRDMCFVYGNTKVADMNSKKHNTYVYRFDYETIITKKLNIGAFHGMEIMFAFNNLECELSKIVAYEKSNSKMMADMIHKYWINFIKESNPNSSELFHWVKYTEQKRETLSIDLNPSIILNPDKLGYDIWKNCLLYGSKR